MNRGIARVFAATVAAAAVSPLAAEVADGDTRSVISIDSTISLGSVDPLLFGTNHRWVADAAGSADSRTGETYSSVIAQIKEIGISMVRFPAGTLGNLYQ